MIKLDQAEMIIYDQQGLMILVDTWNYSQLVKISLFFGCICGI